MRLKLIVMEPLETIIQSASDLTVAFAVISLAIFIFSLISFKINRAHDFVNFTPTLLTTLGIFGTFIGIVLGLWDFNETKIEESIPKLLLGLKTAFITSIVGMFFSILFKFLTTVPWFKPKQAIENTVPDDIAPEILKTMQEQVKETKTLRQSLVGDEETSLFGQLKLLRVDVRDYTTKRQKEAEQFQEKLWSELEKVSQALAKSATEQVIEALKNVIQDFNNQLTEQFGENFKELNAAVKLLVTWQDNYKLQLEDMQKQYEQGVQAIEDTEKSVTLISENMKEVSESIIGVESAVTNISQESEKIPEVMSQLGDVIEVNQHQITELEAHLKAFVAMKEQAVTAIPEIQDYLNKIMQEMSNASSEVVQQYKTIISNTENLINKQTHSSNTLLEKLAETTEKSIKNAESISEKAQQELEQVIKKISEKTFDALEKQIQEQVSKTGAVVEGQVKVIDDQLHKQINESFEKMGTELVKITGRFTQDYIKLTEQMKQVVNRANEF